MTKVKALRSFDHGKARRKGDEFEVSADHAKTMERKKLVVVLGETGNEQSADGGPSSASQADQASTATTASSSGNGDKVAKVTKQAKAPKPPKVVKEPSS